MNPKFKCTCLFGNPDIAISENCPIHGKIDYTNIEQLAKDVWLFLTNDSMPDEAVIKKEAALHEVAAMITSAVAFNQDKLLKEHLQVLGSLNKRFEQVTQQYSDEMMLLRAKNIALTQENELLKNKPA
jgi:hypothetical protein